MVIAAAILKHAPHVVIIITMLREIMTRRQLVSSDCFFHYPNIVELEQGSGWTGSMGVGK